MMNSSMLLVLRLGFSCDLVILLQWLLEIDGYNTALLRGTHPAQETQVQSKQ